MDRFYYTCGACVEVRWNYVTLNGGYITDAKVYFEELGCDSPESAADKHHARECPTCKLRSQLGVRTNKQSV